MQFSLLDVNRTQIQQPSRLLKPFELLLIFCTFSGLLYHETGRHKMAEERYRLAILYRPAMAVAYLNLGVVMAAQQQKEAAKLVRCCLVKYIC